MTRRNATPCCKQYEESGLPAFNDTGSFLLESHSDQDTSNSPLLAIRGVFTFGYKWCGELRLHAVNVNFLIWISPQSQAKVKKVSETVRGHGNDFVGMINSINLVRWAVSFKMHRGFGSSMRKKPNSHRFGVVPVDFHTWLQTILV